MTWVLVTGVGLVVETVVIVALASGATARWDAERWGPPEAGNGAPDPPRRRPPPAPDGRARRGTPSPTSG